MEAAALGLRVEGVSGIDKASASLDKLSGSAGNAERAAEGLQGQYRTTTKALADASRSADEFSNSLQKILDRANPLGKAHRENARDADILKKAYREGRISSEEFARANDFLERELKDAERALGKTSAAASSMAQIVRRAGGAVAAALGVRQLQQYADSWSDMTSLVRVNIGAHEDAAEVMERLADIARSTYSSLELTAQGFAQNAFTLNALGKTTKQQLDYTAALNNALVVSGAKGQQAQMVQDSLNRAMAEGSLRGQELQNVLNYGSTVASLLAEELGVNVTQLREVAKEGRITADVIFNALVKNMEMLEETAETMPATIGDAFLLMRNSVLQAVGVFDQANGLSESFAERLVDIADAIRNTDWGPYIRALTTGAKIAAAYVAAIYAIPVAKAAAAAATAGYQAVLAAFSAQAAVTTAQLWSMNTALGVVGAAFAGWQIGTYLRNEFEFVERAGIALMGGLHTIAIRIGGFFSVMGESIKFAFLNPLDAVRGGIADLLEWIAGLGRDVLRFLGFEGLADSIQTEFAGLRGTVAAEHKATLAQIRADTAAEVEFVNGIYADMFANVGKNAAEASSGISDVAGEVGNLTEETVKLTAAQKAAAAAEKRRLEGILNELSALERAVATWGMTSEEVKIYDLAMQGATAAQLEYAQGMLDTLAALEKAKEEEEAYLQLVKDLRTDEERLTDEFHERIAVLDAMAASTRIASDEYEAMASRLAEAAFTAAPEFGGLAPEVGGPFGELMKIDEAQENLQLWYDTQLEMLEEFRAERADLNAQWDEQELALKQEHEEKLAQIEQARSMAQLAAAESLFGDLADITKTFAGEQSGIYKTMFAIQKAASIAQSMVAIQTGIAMAAANPFPMNLAAMASVAAATASIVGNISAIGMAHEGIDKVPKTGTWLLEKGERVTTAETSAKLDRTLDEVMGRMQALPTNVIPFPSQPSNNVGNSTNVVVNVHNAPPGTQMEQSTSQDGTDVIDIWIADFTSGGRTASAVQGKFGLQPQGR